MTERRVWVVEETQSGFGLGQKQTLGTYLENEEGWRWVRPDFLLTDEQKAEWDRVLTLLKDVKGEDLRRLVCFAGLLDHCMGRGQKYLDGMVG
jgi:hypothetical protein